MSKVLVTREKLDKLASIIGGKADVAVPLTIDGTIAAAETLGKGGAEPNLQTKSVSITPSGSAQSQSVTPDTGYDGLDQVNVNVSAVPEAVVTYDGYDYQFFDSNGSRMYKERTIDFVGTGGFSGPYETYDSIYGNWITHNAIAKNTSVTPTESAQTIGSKYTVMEGAVTVNAIPSNYVGSSITQRTSSDVTSSGDTVTIPGGFYGSSVTKIISAVTQDNDGYLVLDDEGSGGGGGGSEKLSDPIRFFDYDGTLVASYSSVPSSLPAVPSHAGLKDGAWNYTLQQITTQFTASGTCDIGANYMTSSEKTEIDIEFATDARLSPYLRFAVNGTVTVDWGDGSSTEDVTGTSLSTRIDIQHTYSQAGKYTIALANTSGSYAMYDDSSTYTLLHRNSETVNVNRVYANCVKAVRIGKNCSIVSNAFQYCSSLSAITIPSGVTSIGSYAFKYCHSLSSVTIPSDVTSIGNNAFEYCYSLSSVTIPSDVTSIGNNVFDTCSSLSSVTIPSGVTSIATAMFYQCSSLSSITIPSGVTSIGSYAFDTCSSLSSVAIPSSVTSIEGSAFARCSSLSSIAIPSGVTSIGASEFISCSSLSSITIPSGVTSIEGSTFSGCYSLSSVTIPSGVTSIGGYAFNTCYGMKEYHFERTTPPTLGTAAFRNISSDCIIYVPRSSGQTVLNAYKSADNWSDWASYMQEEPA